MWRQGFGRGEIAERLGITPNAVSVHLLRLRRRAGSAYVAMATLTREQEAILRMEAAARRAQPNALAERIIQTVLGDNLVGAVLDTGGEA